MKHIDPQITVKEALNLTNGNQAKLAGLLGIERASVNEWVSSGREFLPTLQAYRLERLIDKKQVA